MARTRKAKSGKGDMPDNPFWQSLTELYPDHAALQQQSVYAIPKGLIDRIQAESKLFSKEEIRFELDLAGMPCDGFFMGQPFSYPLFTPPDQRPDNEATRPTVERLRQSHIQDMKRGFRTHTQIKKYFTEARAIAKDVWQRQLGYAGWLVTHPVFRFDRDRFREAWGERIERERAFPRLPLSYFGERPRSVPEKDLPFFVDYHGFYLRWGLETLTTWDLPVPIPPELAQKALFDLTGFDFLYQVL